MEIFDGKTGQSLEEDVEDLKEKSQKRYESEQPPGYEDYGEDEYVSRGECEDFIIWRQLLVFAEQAGEDVVFITGEKKPDWWEVDDKHEIVRPRYELLREFGRRAGQTFWMLTTEEMLDNAYDRLGVEVRKKSVEQTGKIPESMGLSVEEPMGKVDEIGDLVSVFSDLSECLKYARHNISEERWSVSENIISDAKRYYENAIGKEKSKILSKEKMSNIALGINEIEKHISSKRKNEALEYEKEVRSVTNQILERLADERSRLAQNMME
jgi:hypothetical protein